MTNIYPLPSNDQISGFQEFAGYINDISGGIFFPLLLLTLFLIIFVSTLRFGTARAWVFSSFICSVLSIFLVISKFLNPTYMYLLFISTAIGLLLLRISKSSEFPQI